MEEYSYINTATLGTEYLMTNATTHSFLFGAMAELVDNARDAGSSTLEIYTERKMDGSFTPLLCFKDDGCGMNKEETDNVIIFGSSRKTDQEEPIGMYGNGLKSGSMRLGKDMVLFTKKDDVLTCLMISRTFFQTENLTQIKVPVPSFYASTKKMYGKDARKHSTEVLLINKYSPFKDEAALLAQFDKINTPSGTLVVIYNLSTSPNGDLELDFDTDPYDIITAVKNDEDMNENVADVPERTSFRAYASILYKSPRMKILLRGKRVRTRLLAYSLHLPRRILVNYKSFKNQSEKQINEAKKQIEVTKRKLTEVQAQISNLNKNSSGVANKSYLIQLRKLQGVEAEISAQLNEKKGVMELRKKQAKKSEQLEFFFGMNINERYHDGMFFYNGDRLIKMYVKEGTLQSKDEITYRGIIAVVSVPKSSLLPTHNKQDFNDHAEYKKLKKCVDQAMQQYWNHDVLASFESLPALWESFGYTGSDWRQRPSESENFKIVRARAVKHLQQCDKCLKWRVIPFHKNYLYKDFPDNWQCCDSFDPSTNSCEKSEQLPKIESQQLKQRAAEKPPQDKRENGSKKIRPADSSPEKSEKHTVALQGKKRKALVEEKEEELTPKRKPELSSGVKSKTPTQDSHSKTPNQNSKKDIDIDKHKTHRNSNGDLKVKALIHSPSLQKQKVPPTSPAEERSPTKVPKLPASRRRSTTPERPPLRFMRRPSPSRTVKQETSTPVSKSSSKSTLDIEKENVIEDQQANGTELNPPSAPKTEEHQSSSTVKVEKSFSELNGTLPKNKKYKIISIEDLQEKMLQIGFKVQGRYQNKWQEAEVLELRPDNVLVRFKNKISLALKVKNPDKNQSGEIRIETEDGDVDEDNQENVEKASTAANSTLQKKLISVISKLDTSLDVSNLSLPQLANLDVCELLKKYSTKIKEEATTLASNQYKKEMEKETETMTAEIAQLKEDAKQREKYWIEREAERFERIRSLFTKVLVVCIGSGPESHFTTYDQLVELLENIAHSLTE